MPIFFSILVVALFNPLLRWLEGVVDRYIFRQDYDPARVQAEISLFLRSLDSAASLAKGFIDRVTAPLGIASAVIVYRAKEAAEYHDRGERGDGTEDRHDFGRNRAPCAKFGLPQTIGPWPATK